MTSPDSSIEARSVSRPPEAQPAKVSSTDAFGLMRVMRTMPPRYCRVVASHPASSYHPYVPVASIGTADFAPEPRVNGRSPTSFSSSIHAALK